MKQVIALLSFALVSGATIAQVGKQVNNTSYSKAKVYISVDKPVRGVATEDKTILINPEKGSYAYIIVDNYPNTFPTSQIQLTSFKKYGGEYEKIDSKTYDIDRSLTFTYIQYSFNTTGDYAFDVHDGNGTFINSAYVTANAKTSTTTNDGGSGKYSKAKAYIALDVPVAGVAKQVSSIVINPDKGSYAYIVIDNYPTNFNVDKINLKSYKKVNGKYEKLNDQTYNISGDNYYTYIKYSFYTKGEYAFDVYDENDVFVATAYVTVGYK